MKKILISITGSYTAVLYDPYTPPITADLDNHMHLNALSGFVRIVMDVPDSSLHYEWEAYSSDGSEVSLQYSGLHNERYLSLNGTPRSVTIRVLLKNGTGSNNNPAGTIWNTVMKEVYAKLDEKNKKYVNK